MSIIRVVASGVICSGALLNAQATAQVGGTVTDTLGSLVPNVTIRIISLDRPPSVSFRGGVAFASTADSQFSALSDAAGRYVINNVPAGLYRLCAIDQGLHLNPCDWNENIRITVIGTGILQQNVRLRTGVKLVIQIRDPKSVAKVNPATGDLFAYGRLNATNAVPGRSLIVRCVGPSVWEMEAAVPAESGHTVQISIPGHSFIQTGIGTSPGISGAGSAGGSLSLPIPFNQVPVRPSVVSLPRSSFGNPHRRPATVLSLELQ